MVKDKAFEYIKTILGFLPSGFIFDNRNIDKAFLAAKESKPSGIVLLELEFKLTPKVYSNMLHESIDVLCQEGLIEKIGTQYKIKNNLKMEAIKSLINLGRAHAYVSDTAEIIKNNLSV